MNKTASPGRYCLGRRFFMGKKFGSFLAGAAAGAINGLFAAGGGMVLIPLLERTGAFTEKEVFSSSVVIILPICLVTLAVNAGFQELPWGTALPYLLGSLPGGVLAAILGRKIPVVWLHRLLGILILYGGIRYLC